MPTVVPSPRRAPGLDQIAVALAKLLTGLGRAAVSHVICRGIAIEEIENLVKGVTNMRFGNPEWPTRPPEIGLCMRGKTHRAQSQPINTGRGPTGVVSVIGVALSA
jgi:hypothetical protein